ncbi:hypothetical protein [Algoriphagus kandeliae]|uniref:hypothetical protein n=1 Tax=Algoriphagus kandeliae TaxID=2562278 RepID=UPI0013867D09|nr:hypothetical protein [Algoriphagus kandeliae]
MPSNEKEMPFDEKALEKAIGAIFQQNLKRGLFEYEQFLVSGRTKKSPDRTPGDLVN